MIRVPTPSRPTAPVPRSLLRLAAALLFISGCSKSEPPHKPVTPLDLGTVGAVTGQVRFEGNPPQEPALQLRGFAECLAQHPEPVFPGDVLVKDGRLQNVLIYVREGLGDRTFAVPQTPVVIDQKGCLFVPRVVGAQTGQPVRFMNTDPLMHNVHGVPKKSSAWNFNLAVKGASRSVTIDTPENVIELKCDVHPWMTAYLGVFDHPYFAVTDASGSFTLRNLPPGQYVIEAWHERFGTRTANVAIGPKETKEISFSFTG